jgi:hypothetical protein
MPRGVYDRSKAKPKAEVPGIVVPDGPNPLVGDGAPLVYRDRSGPPRILKPSEGADNFSAITKAAHEPEPRVEPNPQAEVVPHVRR